MLPDSLCKETATVRTTLASPFPLNKNLTEQRLRRALPTRIEPDPFKQLTANLVIARYRAGALPECVLVALLASAGLQP
jgi:hypothetical protein